MFRSLLSLAKSTSFKLLVLVLVLAGATVAILNAQLSHAREQLRITEEALRAQKSLTEALDNQAQLESRLRGIVEDAVSEIEASPNAGELVPPDIATAWYNGIERLRNHESTDRAGEPKGLSASRGSGPHGANNRTTDYVLAKAGRSLPDVQEQSYSAGKDHRA